MIFDDRRCVLGEGPMWHPERKELFWFDILGRKLMSKSAEWTFDDYVSAAGWVDRDRLLVAGQSAIWLFDILTGQRQRLCGLEEDNTATRSNDGRADPYGGFWIGTMGINAEYGAGAIYRYWRGEVVKLFDKITISNAISFAPDGRTAYFTDTPTARIMRVALTDSGWPKGNPETHIDLTGTGLKPDGAVVDVSGNLWNAQWGASRVAAYTPDGDFLTEVAFGGVQTSCPAFGGDDLSTLYCTTAAIGQPDEAFGEGCVYVATTTYRGQLEHRVIV